MSQWKWGTYITVSHLNIFADWGLISLKGTIGHFLSWELGFCTIQVTDGVFSSSYFSEQVCTFTLGSQGNVYKNPEIWKDFCYIMCFHNRKFAYKHSLSPKKKKVWLTENSIQGRTESELTAPWTQNSPQDLSASRASHGVSQRSQPQIQTRLLEKHIPGPTHRCQVHPMIIAMDFGATQRLPRGRRWKEIGSTLPTVGRGSAKATLNLPVSAILLCSCTILMQILSIVFQGLTEIL